MGTNDSRPCFDPSCETMDLCEQGIDGVIPYSIKNNNIKKMDLSNNSIRKLPKKTTKLKILNLSRNKLNEIPKSMVKRIITYKLLKNLDLSFNELKSLPPESSKLLTLKHL